jgi:hypothetical protein
MLLSTKFVDAMGNILNAGDIAALCSSGSMCWDSLQMRAGQRNKPASLSARTSSPHCSKNAAAPKGAPLGLGEGRAVLQRSPLPG